jgi:hypothetical protein
MVTTLLSPFSTSSLKVCSCGSRIQGEGPPDLGDNVIDFAKNWQKGQKLKKLSNKANNIGKKRIFAPNTAAKIMFFSRNSPAILLKTTQLGKKLAPRPKKLTKR